MDSMTLTRHFERDPTVKMRLLLSSIILFLTVCSASTSHASRSEALFILNDLLAHGAEATHPEGFRLLIDAYFNGVKCLPDKPALAEGYFSLVKKYGEMLNPYFTTEGRNKSIIGAPKGSKARPEILSLATPPAQGQGHKAKQLTQLAPVQPEPAVPKTVQLQPVQPEPELTPVQPAPVQPAPVQPAPVQPAPVQHAPVQHAPVQHAPVQFASVQFEPAQREPAGLQPVRLEPVQEQIGAGRQEEDSAGDPADDQSETTAEEQVLRVDRADPEGAIVVGGESSYHVAQHDTVPRVAAKFSMSPKYLLKLNRLGPTAKLHKGQILRIVNRHIVPKRLINGLLINVADCTLYLFKNGTVASALPVVVGRPKSGEERSWQTPLGSFKVTAKVKDPTWHIPASIQKEMEDRGEEVQSEIPPGPDNPLGKFAIRTTLPGILIHGTNASSLKSGPLSHGCIRVAQNKIEALFNEVKVNASGEIIYRPVKIAVHSDGRIFLEVHKDIYRKFGDMTGEVRAAIAKLNLEPAIDWSKVGRVVREESGFAEAISL
jgi:lipoprotein-anchoring transpeptidase ErfK/SrfK